MTVDDTFKKMLLGRTFGTEKGRIVLFNKIPFILYPTRAWAINLQSIGEKAGKKYLYKLGYNSADNNIKEFSESLNTELKKGDTTQRILSPFLDFLGWGKPIIINQEITKKKHHIVIHIKDNPTINHARNLYGKKSVVCEFFLGFYSALFDNFFGIKTKFKETKCLTKGSPYCEFISKG